MHLFHHFRHNNAWNYICCWSINQTLYRLWSDCSIPSFPVYMWFLWQYLCTSYRYSQALSYHCPGPHRIFRLVSTCFCTGWMCSNWDYECVSVNSHLTVSYACEIQWNFWMKIWVAKILLAREKFLYFWVSWSLPSIFLAYCPEKSGPCFANLTIAEFWLHGGYISSVTKILSLQQ